MKRILRVLFWVIVVGAISSLFIFANQRQKKLICPKFEIVVDYQQAPVLITQGNIRLQITENKIKVRGNEIGKIEVEKIQQLLDANLFLKKATITIGVNGVVKAALVQRTPIVRVIDLKGSQFYVDDEGNLMPLSAEFPARVIIASGNIKTVGKISKHTYAKDAKLSYQHLPKDIQQIYVVSMAIRSDAFTNALIEQIFVNDLGELELIPKIGQQNIILGDTSRIAEKIENLKVFYTDGMKNACWTTYKTINLKYRNQIVCTKTK